MNKFSSIGDVVDLFCPGKHDKEGKLFGFVRFAKDSDGERILEGLNNLWFGSYKLRDFSPKYKRGVIPRSNGEGIRLLKKVHNPLVTSSSLRKENQSFADTVLGAKQTNEAIELECFDVGYTSSIADREWLKNCYSGSLKREFPWENY